MSETIGCADNSCIFKVLRGPGMGTNGGCRCFDSLISWVGDEHTGRWNRDEVKRVERDTRRLRAEVERLKAALRDVAERQREACAREVEGVATYPGGIEQDEEGLRDECVGAVRAALLVTEEKP